MFYVSLRKVPDKIIEGIVSLRVLLATPIGNHAYRKAIFAAICILTIVVFGAVIAAIGSSKTIVYASSVNGPSHSGAGTGNPALTPKLLWNYTTGGWVFSSPAVVNGVVYIGSSNYKGIEGPPFPNIGNVYALNATSGAKLWNYTTGVLLYSSPAVVNGVVYIGSFDGNVYALNATSGNQIWNYTTGGVWSSPVVVNGVVYIGSNGNVYALGSSSTLTPTASPTPTPTSTPPPTPTPTPTSTPIATPTPAQSSTTSNPTALLNLALAQSSLPQGSIYGIVVVIVIVVIIAAVLLLRKRGTESQ